MKEIPNIPTTYRVLRFLNGQWTQSQEFNTLEEARKEAEHISFGYKEPKPYRIVKQEQIDNCDLGITGSVFCSKHGQIHY